MPKSKKKHITFHYKDGKLWYSSPIPNNPRDNKLYGDRDKSDASIKNVLYDAKSSSNQNLHKEDLNKFVSSFRKMYYSGKTKRFKDFMRDVEELLDILD